VEHLTSKELDIYRRGFEDGSRPAWLVHLLSFATGIAVGLLVATFFLYRS
jgi:hypothetical protein